MTHKPTTFEAAMEKLNNPNEYQVGGNHYRDLTLQPWELMEGILSKEEFVGFLKGNAIKYAMRQGRKDSDDANKARHYLAKLAEVLNDGE
jgi:hypothetical protein